jgi:thiamine pyrophosphokinase
MTWGGGGTTLEHAARSINHPYAYRLFFLTLITVAEVIRVRTANKHLLFGNIYQHRKCKRITATCNAFKEEMENLPGFSQRV